MALRAVSSRNRRDGLSTCVAVGSGIENLLLVVEFLLRELVGIVEHHGHMPAAAHRERLARGDIHEEVRRRVGRHRIGQTADPAVLLAAVGSGGVPVRHRSEMRERRVLVAAAVHDGQLAVLIEALESGHAAAEAEMVVDRADLLLGDAEMRAVLVIRVVAVGNQRVESVVAAGQFQHDENLAIGFALRGELPRPPVRTQAAEDAPAVTQTPYMPARKRSRLLDFENEKRLFFMGMSSLTQLILGLAHDQVQDQPQRVLHISLGDGDVRRAQFFVEKRHQLLARLIARRDAHEAVNQVIDDLRGVLEILARSTIRARLTCAVSRGIGLTRSIAICEPRKLP